MTRALVTARSDAGMASAPHALAAAAGRDVLAEGGNALEAGIAIGAAIAALYPHMNGLGGDAFWLVHAPAGAARPEGAPSDAEGPSGATKDAPVAIMAGGPAGSKATPAFYAARDLAHVPARGPYAANTVAGCVGAWIEALALAREAGGRMGLDRLLAPAIAHAESAPAAPSFARMVAACAGELSQVAGFADTFLPGGRAPRSGEAFANPRLAAVLRRLARDGLDGFYRGRLADAIAADLATLDSPVSRDDLAAFRAARAAPLSATLRCGTVYNTPPPTQGLASLIILGLLDRLAPAEEDGFDMVHGAIEAAKRAYDIRDRAIGDPAYMTDDPAAWLAPDALDRLAAGIDRRRAGAWGGTGAAPGDTVWFGAADRMGNVVSVIQSVYWEFGSGMVLPKTGILWQNRGTAFDVDPRAPQAIAPGRLPFHTLNPALAVLNDGRVMAYGTMGGDGQPQFQAAIFARHVLFGRDLQESVSAPRWLVGRTWGDDAADLRIETRFDRRLVAALREAGHAVQPAGPWAEFMGHAGAVVRHDDGRMEGATDPRSDGAALGA